MQGTKNQRLKSHPATMDIIGVLLDSNCLVPSPRRMVAVNQYSQELRHGPSKAKEWQLGKLQATNDRRPHITNTIGNARQDRYYTAASVTAVTEMPMPIVPARRRIEANDESTKVPPKVIVLKAPLQGQQQRHHRQSSSLIRISPQPQYLQHSR